MENNNSIPLISVILPVYNGSDYLKQSVESVLKQGLENFEFLILDDNSSDGSLEWLQGLEDRRIKLYVNEMNKGLFYNLNYLVKQCRSKLIKLWAQDDIMYPNCLRAFVDFHQQHPGIGFSYSERDIIDENGKVKPNDKIDITPAIVSPDLHARIAYFTGSIAGNIANVCINKRALDKVGLFNEKMKISADFDMWVRLAKDHDTGYIREKLIKLRDHGGQLSRNEKYYLNHVREDMEVYRYLNSYVNPLIRKEGKILLRKYKLVFYYKLMLKALMKGDIRSAMEYMKLLHAFDNLPLLSFSFIKSKLKRPLSPEIK